MFGVLEEFEMKEIPEPLDQSGELRQDLETSAIPSRRSFQRVNGRGICLPDLPAFV
jgi:hypothetical protein